MRNAPAAGVRIFGLALACSALLGACSGTAPVDVQPPPRAAVGSAYLLDPLESYPLAAAGALAAALDAAWAELERGGEPGRVAARAEELLAADPGFHPAVVLLAVTAFLEPDDARVVELLSPVADELPGYHAANLPLGRALERLGRLLEAFETYLRSEEVEAASRRLDELRPRVFEISAGRFEDRLRRGRLEEAEKEVLRLERWAPGEGVTLEVRRRLAEATGDAAAERVALRGLLDREPDRRDLLERLADLEAEAENFEASLEILRRLGSSYPEDDALAQKQQRVTFLWRLRLLPARVQEIARKGELERADMASLLFWLVPEVRLARVENPPIATDILDHPRRDEILRVIDLGLMPVDESVHRFEPGRSLSRLRALSALVRLLAVSGRPVSCAAGAEGAAGISAALVCRTAAGCGLIPDVGDCLPSASLSGLEALELFRRTLDLLDS